MHKMTHDELFQCRVCGLEYDEPTWGEDGMTPSFDICACCGTEFGYEDATLTAIRNYRQEWLRNGARWWDPKLQPEGWNLEAQLDCIPPRFR